MQLSNSTAQTTMAQKKPISICPHWSDSQKKCLVSENGLFIPLEQHITTYCTSNRHTECIQFKTESSRQQNRRIASPENRRQYPRIHSSEQIIVNKFTPSGKLDIHHKENAALVDLSIGGMKIQLHEPLFQDTLLKFSFQNEGTRETIPQGFARVRWCTYDKNSLGYAAGLAFNDIDTINSVKANIPLPLQ